VESEYLDSCTRANIAVVSRLTIPEVLHKLSSSSFSLDDGVIES
jgi:hypothetical protein